MYQFLKSNLKVIILLVIFIEIFVLVDNHDFTLAFFPIALIFIGFTVIRSAEDEDETKK